MKIEVARYKDSRHWAIYLNGELLAVTVYRRGARAVALTLARLAVGLDLEGGAR